MMYDDDDDDDDDDDHCFPFQFSQLPSVSGL
jgi:hypothetical protein